MSKYQVKNGTVYIVGAGPGSADLIAVRGRDIIEQADLILYADSLVELSVAELAKKPTATIVPSSGLHLDQMVDMMIEAARTGKVVARVHSGDPALYGATHEQMVLLEDANVPFEIVPGITAAFAAAAKLGVELTIPDVVQTIILTRTAGRTTMPAGEELHVLAAPGASLAIYLSVTRIKRVIEDLIGSGGYTEATPCAVLHKVTWPDESMVVGTLGDITGKVRQAGYTKHALILVSPALDPELKKERRTSSHLYDKSYTHRFRKAEDFRRGKEKREQTATAVAVNSEQKTVNGNAIVLGERHLGAMREGTVVIGVTKNGAVLARKLAKGLNGEAVIPEKFGVNGTSVYADSALAEVRRRWAKAQNLVLVMPTGVATRAVAPLLREKTVDPAVVVVDEGGNWAIPLIGGHLAGANELAEQIEDLIEARAVVTTASDLQGLPSLDMLARDAGWGVEGALTHVMGCLVNGENVGVFTAESAEDAEKKLSEVLAIEHVERVADLNALEIDDYSGVIIVSDRALSDRHLHLLRKGVVFRPKTLTIGMGCKRDTSLSELRDALQTTLRDAELAIDSIRAISTVDLKADESGLIALANELGVPLMAVNSEQLAVNSGQFGELSASAATEKLGLVGVAEPTALIVSEGELIVKKRSFAHCTVAIARS